MIPLASILVVTFDGRGRINEPLARWMRQFPRATLASACGIDAGLPIADQRNLAWQHFRTADTQPNWLLMMDDDQVPVPPTDELFTLPYPYPVMGARYFGKHGQEVHQADGYVGCGCLLVNRVAADMIGDDPFTRQPDEPCECLAFCRRAQQAGFWPHKRGRIGHRCLVDVLPDDAEGYKIRFAAPSTPPHGNGENLPPPQPLAGEPWSGDVHGVFTYRQ